MHNIIFLDIDGVLVTGNSPVDNYMHNDLSKDSHDLFDPRAVININKLAYETKSKIVLSSSWKFYHPRPKLYKIMKNGGIVASIVGVTPNVDSPHSRRGVEIRIWLDKFRKVVKTFVIIDDVPGNIMELYPDNCVITDRQYGFVTDTLYEQAYKILSK